MTREQRGQGRGDNGRRGQWRDSGRPRNDDRRRDESRREERGNRKPDTERGAQPDFRIVAKDGDVFVGIAAFWKDDEQRHGFSGGLDRNTRKLTVENVDGTRIVIERKRSGEVVGGYVNLYVPNPATDERDDRDDRDDRDQSERDVEDNYRESLRD